jgi:hypothetical protein
MGFHILEKSKLKSTECFTTQLCLLQRKKKLILKFLTDTDSLYIEWDFSNSKFKNYYEFIQELSNETKSLICIHSLWRSKRKKKSDYF